MKKKSFIPERTIFTDLLKKISWTAYNMQFLNTLLYFIFTFKSYCVYHLVNIKYVYIHILKIIITGGEKKKIMVKEMQERTQIINFYLVQYNYLFIYLFLKV